MKIKLQESEHYVEVQETNKEINHIRKLQKAILVITKRWRCSFWNPKESLNRCKRAQNCLFVHSTWEVDVWDLSKE